MDKDEIYYLIVDLLKTLISIDRSSRLEKEATDYIQSFLCSINNNTFNIQRCGNNLILSPFDINPDKPTLLLNSHIDTVKPTSGWLTNPYEPIEDIESGKIYGLGSNDAGASLVTLIGTFLYFNLNDISSQFNLILAISAEEEISGHDGFEKIKDILPLIDFAIVGEPTGMNPAVAEKGLMVLDMVIKGRSGHAAREEGDNAIYKAIPIVGTLRSLTFPKVSEWLGPVKITTTQINGGTQHNVIPDKCSLVVDIRTTDQYTNSETLEIIRKSLPEWCEIVPRSLRLEPTSISIANPVVQRLIALGKKPFGSPTLSDSALMPWPAIKVGPGDSARSHSPNEFILLNEIREALEIYISVLS